MWTYTADLRDLAFVLHEQLEQMNAFHLDPAEAGAAISTAALEAMGYGGGDE